MLADEQRERELVYAIRTYEEAVDGYEAAQKAVADALARQTLARNTKKMAEEVLAKKLSGDAATFEGKLYRGRGNDVEVEDCQLFIKLDRSRS